MNYQLYKLNTEPKKGWVVVYTNDVNSYRGQVCAKHYLDSIEVISGNIITVVDWDKNSNPQKFEVLPKMIAVGSVFYDGKGEHYLIKIDDILAKNLITV